MSTSGLGGRYCILWPGLAWSLLEKKNSEDLAKSDERRGVG